jgi:alpha-beta hydrolase superfamily lysophospholipase
MERLNSKDGTTLAYDRLGDGPPVILVCGGSVDRMSNAPLAEHLSQHFTVYNFDRRGRRDTGDTPPYAIQREIEDIEAFIKESGGLAFLYGSSSGAALAMLATASGLSVRKLALWEAPFIVEGTRPFPPPNTADIYREMIESGRRGDAAEYFMVKVVGLPQEFADQARTQPWWAAQEAIAHTLVYDATVMGDYSLPYERAAAVKVPTLVMDGGASFDWIRTTARTLAESIPDAKHRTLEGQTHAVDASVLAPVMTEFFTK